MKGICIGKQEDDRVDLCYLTVEGRRLEAARCIRPTEAFAFPKHLLGDVLTG